MSFFIGFFRYVFMSVVLSFCSFMLFKVFYVLVPLVIYVCISFVMDVSLYVFLYRMYCFD